jgi:hypothetical protein
LDQSRREQFYLWYSIFSPQHTTPFTCSNANSLVVRWFFGWGKTEAIKNLLFRQTNVYVQVLLVLLINTRLFFSRYLKFHASNLS